MVLLRRALTVACLVGVVLVAVMQAHDAIATPGRGLDFGDLRDAAVALTRGVSVYANPRFVYPPTAAVALLPWSAGSRAGATDVWLVMCTVAVVLAGALAMAPWRRGSWVLLAVLAAGLMAKSDALTDSLWIGNVSLLLAPVAVLVLLCFESGRWRAGCALLVLTLLIKPLLLPLVLLPLLRGHWRELFEALAGGCLLLALAIVLVPGGGHFFAVIHFLLGGGTLNGRAAVYNTSIGGLAARLHASPAGTAARALLVAAVALLAYRFARRPARQGELAGLGTLLILTVLLAGSLSEDHYLLVAAPCLLTALALARRPLTLALSLPGLILFAFPARYLGNVATSPAALQVRFVAAELALAAAAAALLARPGRGPYAASMARGRGRARLVR
jgi:hypothetical protein